MRSSTLMVSDDNGVSSLANSATLAAAQAASEAAISAAVRLRRFFCFFLASTGKLAAMFLLLVGSGRITATFVLLLLLLADSGGEATALIF